MNFVHIHLAINHSPLYATLFAFFFLLIGMIIRNRSIATAGLVLAPWGLLPWAIYLLAATSWLTVLQRVLHVRKQLLSGGTNVDER